MKPTKNGRAVEISHNGGEPYKILFGDEYTCEGCGAKMVTGFGRSGIDHSEQIYQIIRDGEASRGNLLVEVA